MFAKFGVVLAVTLLIVVVVGVTEANWLQTRNLQWHGGLGSIPQQEMRAIKKTFLPPRYQNLWGHGESSKVVGSSALAPQNMDDYKMQSQQRQVFSWQPTNNLFNEW